MDLLKPLFLIFDIASDFLNGYEFLNDEYNLVLERFQKPRFRYDSESCNLRIGSIPGPTWLLDPDSGSVPVGYTVLLYVYFR